MDNGIGSWITYHTEHTADKIALIDKEEVFTYESFNTRINQLANGLWQLGVRKGDRVSVLLFNRHELLEALFACAKMGAIFVPINYRLSVEEVEYITKDAGARVMIYEERTTPVINGLKGRVKDITHYVYVGEEPDVEDITYEHMLEQSSSMEPGLECENDAIHMMMYTSGTTGKPKGAMLTHGNTQWNAINILQALSLDKEDTTLTPAPLFHIGGMNVLTTPMFYLGGTVILQDVFQPSKTLSLIQAHQVTCMFLVPAMWMAIMHAPDIEEYDITSLQLNISGGAPCPLTVIEFFQQRHVPFYEGFGLTETAPFVAILDKENAYRKNGSVGKNPMHTAVRIVDELDREVGIKEVGELCVKGPNIFAGYWNMPIETRQVMKEGWFHTGDLAMKDEEGFMYIVDRKKDMIISGGENIYPIEVEQVLFTHPNVQEAAIVGVPDEKWGEVPKAFLVLKQKDQAVTREALQTFCAQKLANYKIPKHIEFLNALPRNATGKILKTQLRKAQPVKK
ncbi:o-succinylbenzoate--CoA ligase [Pontibacillus salicampi]|uniref:O-succinylbenzoate--CoA ligase n=1 Tax=Pontibacillus salicampi TaxID=1449801 RepID=A0ABV6LQG7_9BACI